MIGLGCMRLSTVEPRDPVRAIAVIHTALDAGVTLLDTADAYCLDDGDTGHNERLIAHALKTWRGDVTRITVATKGGLVRPAGRWVPDGRAKHLYDACAASLRALDVPAIDLYQLHAVDSRVPIETSVRALAELQRSGLIRRIGLSNVTVSQIKAAQKLAEIASVQVSLSVLDEENLRNGVVEYCRDQAIQLIAYRPVGGKRTGRLTKDPLLSEIAERRNVTPHEVALAWLLHLTPNIVPIPGATPEVTAGFKVLAIAWRPQISDGQTTEAAVIDHFERTKELLGVDIEFAFCPHPAGPPVCWCRKPLPGLILEFAFRHRLSLDQSVFIGRSTADRTLASRLGMIYHPSPSGRGRREAPGEV
jgi:aryl-alcohol dehydrogenase-like predicted oxidoreductase